MKRVLQLPLTLIPITDPLDAPSRIGRHSSTGTRVTRSLSLGFGLLRKNLWLWPLLAALALVAAGLWLRSSIETAMREDMAEEVQTLLNTSVAAVELWMNTEQVQAQQVANETEIRRIANELRKVAAGVSGDEAVAALNQSELQGELKRALRSVLSGGRYAGYVLADTNGLVLASDRPQLIGIVPPDPYPELIAKCLQDGATVTRPFPSVVLMRDESGQLRAGLPTMFALAEQRDLTGDVIGVLGLRIRPEEDFVRILRNRPARRDRRDVRLRQKWPAALRKPLHQGPDPAGPCSRSARRSLAAQRARFAIRASI